MKNIILLSVILLTLVCCSNSNNQNDKFPKTSIIGEYTYVGEIAMISNPPTTTPSLPSMVLGLRTDSDDYSLTLNGHLISGKTVNVDGVVYSVGEKVEITGVLNITWISSSEKYNTLEIVKIKKVQD